LPEKEQVSKPEGGRADSGAGVLGKGQPAPSPPARGLGALKFNDCPKKVQKNELVGLKPPAPFPFAYDQ